VRLDAEKLEVLRGWGEGLSTDARDDVRSAGRAILLLIEEIERLHIDLWHLRGVEEPVPGAAPEPAPAAADIESTLRGRLARWLA
jgi:hypothetical protein